MCLWSKQKTIGKGDLPVSAGVSPASLSSGGNREVRLPPSPLAGTKSHHGACQCSQSPTRWEFLEVWFWEASDEKKINHTPKQICSQTIANSTNFFLAEQVLWAQAL